MVAEMHLSTKKMNLFRKNSMGIKYLNPLLNSIKFKSKKFINIEKFLTLKIALRQVKQLLECIKQQRILNFLEKIQWVLNILIHYSIV